MNRKMRRAVAFRKRGHKGQKETNAEIFRDVMILEVANSLKPRQKSGGAGKGGSLDDPRFPSA